MCMILPVVIKRIVKDLEGKIVLNYTVIDELKGLARKQNIESEYLAIVMMIYIYLGLGVIRGL